jgi:hypothetical protein
MIVRARGLPSRVVGMFKRKASHSSCQAPISPKNACEAQNRDVWHRHLTRSTHAAQDDAAKVMPTPVVRKFYML